MIPEETLMFCSTFCDKSEVRDYEKEFGGHYVCGKMLDNPDWGNCSFDNIF